MARDKNTIEENDSAGKGSYWMLDASANDMFEQGNYRRRRTRRQRQCLKTGTLLGESLKVRTKNNFNDINFKKIKINFTKLCIYFKTKFVCLYIRISFTGL